MLKAMIIFSPFRLIFQDFQPSFYCILFLGLLSLREAGSVKVESFHPSHFQQQSLSLRVQEQVLASIQFWTIIWAFVRHFFFI